MEQQNFENFWAREARSRAPGAIIAGTAATCLYYVAFITSFKTRALFDALFLLLIILQFSRGMFALRSRQMPNSRWLALNDRFVLLFAALWSALAMCGAMMEGDGRFVVHATTIMIISAFITSASHFHCFSTRVFQLYAALLAIPALTVTWKMGDSQISYSVTAASLMGTFILLQMRGRSAIWRAVTDLGGVHSDLQDSIDTFPGGLIHIRDSSYFRLNSYAAHLLGQKKEHVLGRKVGSIQSLAEFTELLHRFQRSAEMMESAEVAVSTAEGERTHLVILRRREGFPGDYLIACIDIEALTIAEDDANQEKQRSAEALQTISQLANAVDLPLAAIAEQVLVRKNVDVDKTRESLKEIQVAVNRIKKSVRSHETYDIAS